MDGLFIEKYGRPDEVGWSPRQRLRFRYFLPADIYEGIVSDVIFDGCDWLDIGGGRQIFPENPRLARRLVARARHVVAVDPSANVSDNAFVHDRVQSTLEDYRTERRFDVATLRMVAEHVVEPEAFVNALHALIRPGGVVVVFTVNQWAPLALVARATPFALHSPIKKVFWGGEDKDTFPTCYKMNSRATLRRLFHGAGFTEAGFFYLDDLSTFGAFRRLNYAELLAWSTLRSCGLKYPENCLLGLFRKPPDRQGLP